MVLINSKGAEENAAAAMIDDAVVTDVDRSAGAEIDGQDVKHDGGGGSKLPARRMMASEAPALAIIR